MSQRPRQLPLVDGITIFFLVLAAGSGTLLFVLHGAGHFRDALNGALLLLIAIIPIVVMAVLMGAYVQSLVPASLARRWVGEDSGFRGLVLATIAGAITPGGPFAAFPLVVGMYHAGASLPVCITYLTSWGVIGLQRVLVWEIAFFGLDFVLIRLAVSLPLPILAGMFTAAFLTPRRARKC